MVFKLKPCLFSRDTDIEYDFFPVVPLNHVTLPTNVNGQC